MTLNPQTLRHPGAAAHVELLKAHGFYQFDIKNAPYSIHIPQLSNLKGGIAGDNNLSLFRNVRVSIDGTPRPLLDDKDRAETLFLDLLDLSNLLPLSLGQQFWVQVGHLGLVPFGT